MQQREAGTVQNLAPGVRGVIAPNPGPMTHWGTNSFLIGEREVAIIDPGPNTPSHKAALLKAVGDGQITHILVTHAHLDHSPLARVLSVETGAPILAYGAAEAGRKPVMQALVTGGLSGGGEGVDTAFAPDHALRDGDIVEGAGWTLVTHHTPGHFSGHLAFRFEDVLFSGDHVMDWSSSLVSPPDGDLRDFMTTSRRLRSLGAARFYPAHGGALSDPVERLDWLIAHREAREAAILNAMTQAPASISEITAAVYTDIPRAMLPAAERNVFAHLIDLLERNLVLAEPTLGVSAKYRLA